MKRWMLALALLLAACAQPSGSPGVATQPSTTAYTDNPYVTVYHDDTRLVTCWTYHNGYAGGIACLPDTQLVGRK